MAARVWVLNLDADLELAARGAYTRSRAVDARMPELQMRARRILRPGDVVLGDGEVDVAGRRGHAFCMTASARRLLEDAGAAVVASPPVEVIRRVNHRAFCASLGPGLPGARFARSEAEVADALSAIDSSRGALLKRPFGFAGRGQRRVSGVLSAADRRWLAATPVDEGVQVEPLVPIAVEHAVHGIIRRGDDDPALGEVVVQRIVDGAWQETRPATPDDLTDREREGAHSEALRVAEALAGAGYFGPFGVDGFVYVDELGARRHQPRSEINARYTMGWSLG